MVSGSVVLASYLGLLFMHWLHQDRDTGNKKIKSEESQLKITVKVEAD